MLPHRSHLLPLASAILAFLVTSGEAATSDNNAPAGGAGVGYSNSTTCNWSNLCPEKSPCCSQYGFCGSGQNCLAGCNPLGSFNVSYCAPVPVCQTQNYTFADSSRILTNATSVDGDPTNFDWTLDKLDNNKTGFILGGELGLVLTEAGGGTLISSVRTFLYGNITASIKTPVANGIVTAYITMSGVKDEIDWEFTTNNTAQGQTNYFWEGDTANFTHGGTATAPNRGEQYNVYGVEWGPTQLSWSVNGKIVRTLTKASTESKVTPGLYSYPQTPSRIQLSLWPAGIASEPAGTVEWSGGMIDWNDPQYVSQGYYAALVQWINVECYSSSVVPFVSSNSSATTSNFSANATRLARSLHDNDLTLWERELWERDTENNVASYVYQTNSSLGQIQVVGSDRQTVINSPASTGVEMTVTSGKALNGTTITPPGGSKIGNAVSGWWGKLPTVAHVGIIIGAIAVFLICLIGVCTCFAKRNDKKKAYNQVSGSKDHIPLVEKAAQNSSSYSSKPTLPQYSPDLNRQDPYGYQKGYANESQGSFLPEQPYSQGQPRAQYGGGGGYGGGYGATPQYQQQSQYQQPQWGPRR